MRILPFALLCLTGAAHAEPVLGLDDPAFTAPFRRALEGSDPASLHDVHAAAEAGNTAAQIALPTVLTWLPPTGSLAERNSLRTVNGVSAQAAAASASAVAENWQGGDTTDIASLPERALHLFDAGENTKASA